MYNSGGVLIILLIIIFSILSNRRTRVKQRKKSINVMRKRVTRFDFKNYRIRANKHLYVQLQKENTRRDCDLQTNLNTNTTHIFNMYAHTVL